MLKDKKGISLIVLVLIAVIVIVVGAVSVILVINGNTNINNDKNGSLLNDLIVKNDESTISGEISIKAVKNAKETDASKFDYQEVESGISITDYTGEDEIVVIPKTIMLI